jgi:soluble lytic murein transglycosylase
LPTDTATPTLPPTATPTPTPQPSARLEEALRHQSNGNYALAILTFQALLGSDPTPDEARQAYYHLAESYLLDGEYVAAAVAWMDFIARYPADPALPQATLMAARAYHAAALCSNAISHYENYLAHQPILADMVYEWLGDCHDAEGRLVEAIAAYRQALDASSDRGVQVSLREKIADAYLALEDHDVAVSEYDAILSVAQIDYYRAKIEYLAGQALAAAGQTEAAHSRYRRAVDNYPEAEHAYFSLVELVDAGAEVDELQRGLIDYYAGQTYPDAYGAAVRAFDRYLAAEPAEGADQALFHKGLAQRALDDTNGALESLELLIAGYPESEWLVRAWLEKGATLARAGMNDQAVETYQHLADLFPAHELAPQALWRAAKLREGESSYAQAAERYEDVHARFRTYEDADEALWRAGLARNRAGDVENALANWQALLDEYPQSAYRAKTLYWLGKLSGAPQGEEGTAYWDRLVAVQPRDYYALRVQQIRTGEPLTATRLITSAVEAPNWDADQAQADVLGWLHGWTDVPTGTSLSELPAALADHPDLQRGEELLAVGLRREALAAFDEVRAASWSEPLSLAQLAFYFHDNGLHGLAARSALRLAALWPDGSVYDAPLLLQHLAYPLAYADLLSAEAQEQDLDALLLAALVRQESLFEPVAESYAGARGLGQVMPATGEGIARSLGVDGFVLSDLYRPSVSIRFGAWYLAVQMDRFDDQILIALAAYNGGPGNTLYWIELAGDDDLDLFVEVITASQSRRYLQQVYKQYQMYETLYRSPGTGDP